MFMRLLLQGRRALAPALILLLMVALAPTGRAGEPTWRHGLSLFGALKYPTDFAHYDYVNPNAPKGGTLSQGAEGTFDSLNPFIIKGVAPTTLQELCFDSLLDSSADEPDSAYGLIAEAVSLAGDRRSVSFRLNPKAKFHDGAPITAEDVAFSFDALVKEGDPRFRLVYGDVEAAEVIAPGEVRFRFRSTENRKTPLIVGAMPVFSKTFYATRKFNETTVEPPLCNGPYRVAKADIGRTMVFERVKDYWAAALPVRVGRHNFDTIRYDYFRDRTVMAEAFKAGTYGWREEFTSKTWATAYDIPEIADGRVIKETLEDNRPSGVQAYFINTRHARFADWRVRQALSFAFDFEWANKNLFFDQYERMASYFENSDLAARGMPAPEELALLEPYRDKLPPELFTEAFAPPMTDGSGDARANLRIARKLLIEAGLKVENSALIDPSTGEQFAVEFLYFEPAFERIMAPYARNLERLGIKALLRLVDPAQYQARLKSFDFDLIVQRYVQSLSPGAELRGFFGSRAADEDGSFNLAGIKDPVVDALIEKILSAPDRPALLAATRALDRILLFGHYMVPQWYKGGHNLVYWNKFSRPATKPRFALGLDTWWIDPDKAAALNARGKAID